jgi:integrase
MSRRLPWYRKFNDTWYVQVGQRQIPLAKGRQNRQEAYRRFAELQAQQDLSDPAQSVEALNLASLAEGFLAWTHRHQAPATYQWYREYLQGFCNVEGLTPVLQLKPFHVTQWLDARDWSDSTRRAAITAIKRVLNWGVEEGYLDRNPLQRLKRPPMGQRQVLITEEQHRQMLAATDEHFRQFLVALHDISCDEPHGIERAFFVIVTECVI